MRFFGGHGRREFIGLQKSTLLLVSLKNQGWLKVNSSDNNVEYSTSRRVHITRSNMNFPQI
jgi:hypothetical protein